VNNFSSVCFSRLLILLPFIVAIAASCKSTNHTDPATRIINPDNDSIRFVGRIDHKEDSVKIFWSGTSVSFRFRGTAAKVWLKDEHGQNYFNVIIDGDSLRYFKSNSRKGFHTLVENLSPGEHTIDLVKRTEWDKGSIWVFGFWIDGKLLKLPEPNKRVMEFFGDSITAGYAIEDNTGGDSPDSIFTNNYYTYGAITARHFKADCYQTVKSGIGITISWFPLVMEEMYDRLDPSDAASRWSFGKVQPDVVVINLFQNDSWLIKMPDHPSFKQRYGNKAPSDEDLVNAYYSLLKKIRAVYPQSHIVCCLGSMDAVKEGAPWPGYVTAAVARMVDKKVMTHFFPYSGKGGHPRISDNRKMADSLIAFIEANIKW
jgi:hypothetical protein